MAVERMRLSPAKLLIVVALCLVILIELRTVLAFFGIELAVGQSLGLGAAIIGAIILWVILPLLRTPDDE